MHDQQVSLGLLELTKGGIDVRSRDGFWKITMPSSYEGQANMNHCPNHLSCSFYVFKNLEKAPPPKSADCLHHCFQMEPPQAPAWRIPWTEEFAGLQALGLQRVGHNWATEHKLTLLGVFSLVSQVWWAPRYSYFLGRAKLYVSGGSEFYRCV